MQIYRLKRENGVTPIMGLHRIPTKNILMGLWLKRLFLCYEKSYISAKYLIVLTIWLV